MIKFDVTKLSVDIVNLKSCTTALQGSIRIVDEDQTEILGKEVLKKIKVPFAVVRAFQTQHKVSNYLKPVITAVISYDGTPIALERHPLGTVGALESEGLFGTHTWTPDSQDNINEFIIPLCSGSDNWYFDGCFMYHFPDSVEKCVKAGKFMSQNGAFRSLEVSAISLNKIHDREKIEPQERTCLAFVSSTGQYALTPPIWKQLDDVGGTVLNRSDAEEEDRVFPFDAIDEHLAVNLSFALKAGGEIGQLFGHEAIEPLQLPNLMIELRTVNLPKISRSVKSTYDVGLDFTHAMAWLIGLSNRTDTLASYVVLRSLLKYLTTKGIFRKNMFNENSVFKKGHNLETIPHLTKDDALESAGNISVTELMEQLRNNVNRRNSGTTNVIGGLYGSE